jgi:hypothetical protein
MILIADNLQITHPVVESAIADLQPGRLIIEQVYLSILAAAGLDMLLLNVFHAETVAAAKAGDALIGPKPFAWDEL